MLKFAKGKKRLEEVVKEVIQEGFIVTLVTCSEEDNYIVVYKKGDKEDEKDN